MRKASVTPGKLKQKKYFIHQIGLTTGEMRVLRMLALPYIRATAFGEVTLVVTHIPCVFAKKLVEAITSAIGPEKPVRTRRQRVRR